MRDDNAMSNYFIAVEIFSNLGVILELNNNFQGSFLKAWLSQYWNWISGDSEKKLKENI